MMDRNKPTPADVSPIDDTPPTKGPAPSPDPLATRAPTHAGPFDPSIPTRPPLDTYATATPEASSEAVSPAPPDAFPGYEVLGPLGEGGMGVVYRARQIGLNRIVALKAVLGGRCVSSRDLIRFLAEAETVASIKHPNVVQVFNYGEAGGRPFLAMEYLPGGTLADRLKAGRLQPREAAELVAKLARGVQAAHDQEIVHRDLKPGNVLFDEHDEPKVADFGLAKRARGSNQTHTQAVMGTPAYMSPEQAEGKSKFVGPTADVYALGVVLYECLTGARPFDHDDSRVLLTRVLLDDPEPPSRRAPGLPRDLALITLKCLEKDPADRYPTAAALAEDLARFVAGESVSVRAASSFERALKWARRKPTLAATYALTATVAILLIFGASLAVLWRSAERARATAVGERKAADQAKTTAEVARKHAERAEAAEKTARAAVEVARDKLARVEYGRTMQVAYQEWRDNNIVAALALLGGTQADLRGWEWRYVNHLCHGELLELKDVTSVSWSPDGTRLATTSDDNTTRVWDARTGGESLALDAHTIFETSVSWSPDGTRLATARLDGTARVWDARTGDEALALKGHTDQVNSVSWSPDGTRLATASWDRTARVWDARTGAEALALKGHTSYVTSVSWSPDGARLATAGDDNTARVWDARTGAEALALKGHSGAVNSVSWSPDGTRLATASSDNTARVWDARTGAEALVLKGYSGHVSPTESVVTSVSWSPDGTRLATASWDRTARVWDARTGAEALALKGHASFVTSVSWSPDGTRLATAGLDNTARVWDARTGAEALALKGHSGAVNSVSWSPDGTRLATASEDKTARMWDVRYQSSK